MGPWEQGLLDYYWYSLIYLAIYNPRSMLLLAFISTSISFNDFFDFKLGSNFKMYILAVLTISFSFLSSFLLCFSLIAKNNDKMNCDKTIIKWIVIVSASVFDGDMYVISSIQKHYRFNFQSKFFIISIIQVFKNFLKINYRSRKICWGALFNLHRA